MSGLIGRSIERYQVLEQLGEGGMATVYRAHDATLDRDVAIKVIRTDQFAPSMLSEMMKRFEREARALAKLSHPNIVPVHDFGEFEGAPYLVMEYVPGGSLQDRPPKPMPWQQAVHILLPVTRALDYAHAHNIIHRDIKPGNILITNEGTPMLSDFGIAKILGSNDANTLTGAGMSIGTPEYMAPEQWTGQSSPQSDIYSLGIVLYEMVTGRKPYVADTPAGVMLKQVNEPLPPPRKYVPDLPEPVEKVIMKALERQPQDRYQSMGQFAAALEAVAGGKTLLAGAMPEEDLAGRTILATGLQSKPSTPALGNTPPGGSTSAAPPSDLKIKKRSRRSWIWIPAGLLVVLLCGGAIVGANFLIKRIGGADPLAGGATAVHSSNLPGASTQPNLQGLGSQPSQVSSDGLTPAPTQIKVLWDTSHGPASSSDGTPYTPDGMYSALVKALGTENILVTAGDLSSLESYDTLVLSASSSASKPYTAAEVTQIDQFVRASGHSLLILSDTPVFENLIDPVSRKFSIGLGETTSDTPSTYSNEPFFSGVTSLQFFGGAGIFQVASPSQAAAQDKSGNALVAFCQCDAGRVLAVSDANLWDNNGIASADNKRFALNAFMWLANLLP